MRPPKNQVARSAALLAYNMRFSKVMNPKKCVLVLLIFAVAACGRSGTTQRGQQQYDVVQEGSANGVTSTINAPGETTPVANSTITGTNVDTTTAFTLPGTTKTSSTQPPGTIAGSLPTDSSGFPAGYIPSSPRPRPKPTPQTTTNPPMSSGNTDTAGPPSTTQTAATTTDTVATTTTKDKEKKEANPPPPPTDTTGTQG